MIRLARVGARKQPHYRIVVIEKDRARNGRSVEVVGTYNPRTNPASVDLKRERIDYWTSKGAQLSDRVEKLLAGAPAAAAAPAALVTFCAIFGNAHWFPKICLHRRFPSRILRIPNVDCWYCDPINSATAK
jgi:small subunit ribosomal protein S16